MLARYAFARPVVAIPFFGSSSPPFMQSIPGRYLVRIRSRPPA